MVLEWAVGEVCVGRALRLRVDGATSAMSKSLRSHACHAWVLGFQFQDSRRRRRRAEQSGQREGRAWRAERGRALRAVRSEVPRRL